MNSNQYITKLLLKTFFIYSFAFGKEIAEEVYESRKNRIFTVKQKDKCWDNAEKIPNRDPGRWRFDAAGNPVLKALRGCTGPLCHEYDHILPYSKGGQTTVSNCQILQTQANRRKGNKVEINNQEQLKKYSMKSPCGDLYAMTESKMDLIEEMIYGNVNKPY